VSAVDVQRLVATLASCLPRSDKPIALHEPHLAGNEWAYVKECLDTGWVSTAGPFVERFEQQLAAFTGARRAVAVVNGTAALHVALLLVGVERADEVIVPTLTFVATANAVSYCGAVPHFVDSDEKTLGLDAGKLERHLEQIAEVRDGECRNRQSGRRIRAVVPMHTFGHPVDLDGLLAVCQRWRLELVEDAAESLGSYYKERHTGTFGRVGVLSFNGNKVVTTGGGGAVLTNDAALGDRAKHLTTTARLKHSWAFIHDEVGYNYRLPNLNAALGCAQLEQLPGFVRAKRALAARYERALADVPGVRFLKEPPTARSNYWLNAIALDADAAADRDRILDATNAAGMMTRPVWTLMHQLPMFRDCPRATLDVAESLAARIINVPSSSFLSADDAAPRDASC
jgi:perosamine synthetase